MTTSNERRGLTEPLESVTTFFGTLMIIAALVGVAFLVFGSGTFGGVPGTVCVTQPGAQYGSSDWNIPFAAARPGHSISVIGNLQVCADHPRLGEQALSVTAALPAVLFWGGVLFLLWRMMVTARRNGPFTPRVAAAMRRLGWFIIIGSTAAAVARVVSHIVAWISASMAAPALTIRAKVSSAAPARTGTGRCSGTKIRFGNGLVILVMAVSSVSTASR